MHDIGEGTIRRIDWQELMPVVLLLRVFNISLDLRTMLPAFCGGLLTVAVLTVCGESVSLGVHEIGSIKIPYMTVAADGRAGCRIAVWTAIYLVWILFGSMIVRTAAVRLTNNESESPGNQFRFLRQRGLGFISSVVILIIGILCCLLPVKIAVWLAAMPYVHFVVALFLPIPMLFAFFAAVLAVGLVFGWMLMFAAVCVEGSDGFDAISRMFSYLYQRPLHYVFYWFYCAVLGCIGCGIVWIFTSAVSFLTFDICKFPLDDGMGCFWIDITLFIPLVYCLSWFWTSSTAIYLLLRRSVDATPFNQVYRIKEAKTENLERLTPPVS
ncbi:MAG: hypothetical protein LBT46_06905 [Planctomycetaceae bacterium]|jgi:hypothetical protein|nr:hypothetical protein [Planctomycetaceae bacterium]